MLDPVSVSEAPQASGECSWQRPCARRQTWNTGQCGKTTASGVGGWVGPDVLAGALRSTQQWQKLGQPWREEPRSFGLCGASRSTTVRFGSCTQIQALGVNRAHWASILSSWLC